MRKINILEPNILNNSKKILRETLQKNQISTSSSYIIKKFEKKISLLGGSKYTAATNTGILLYLQFKSLEVKKMIWYNASYTLLLLYICILEDITVVF